MYYPGFIAPRGDSRPANIYTNAQQHIGKTFILNVDLKNFFHLITKEQLHRLFKSNIFKYDDNLITVLTDLCTINNRLPMGAATSPVLSNLACLTLDNKLTELSSDKSWNYTRYADDMTFSSNKKIKKKDYRAIVKVITSEGLQVNPNKVKWYGKRDKALVTGLKLGKSGPDVTQQFIDGIQKDIFLLDSLRQPRILERSLFNPNQLWAFVKSIHGQINFLGYIRGKQDKDYHRLQWQVNQLLQR